MAPRHKAPRRTASLMRRTALSAAAGSVLLTGATASVAMPASAASAPRPAAPSPDRTHPPDTAVLRHRVYDLTLGTADHSAVGQRRLFAAYRALDSLQEYVLVDPDTRRVEVYRRNERGLFELHDQTGREAVEFACVGFTLAMADVFDGVEDTPAS